MPDSKFPICKKILDLDLTFGEAETAATPAADDSRDAEK